MKALVPQQWHLTHIQCVGGNLSPSLVAYLQQHSTMQLYAFTLKFIFHPKTAPLSEISSFLN